MITLGTPSTLPAARDPGAAPGADPASGPADLFAALLAGQVALHALPGAAQAVDEAVTEPVDPALGADADASTLAADPVAGFAPWPAAAASAPAVASGSSPVRARALSGPIPQTGLAPSDSPADAALDPLLAASPVPSRGMLAAHRAGEPAPALGIAAADVATTPANPVPIAIAAAPRPALSAPFALADAASTVGEAPAPAPVATGGLAAASPTAAPPASLASLRIDTPVGRTGWDGEVATRIAFLVRERVTEAQLVLEPAELGPVQARIRFEDGSAIVVLVAARADTREALEAALPRLREMLESGGLTLGDASVSHEKQDAEPRQAGTPGSRGDESGAPGAGAPGTAPSARLLQARGLVDLYA